ncbi:MAG: hypothetical protein ACLVHV_12310 [Oscillospiraceae bacterium]
MNVMEELKGYGLIPVTVLDDAAQAVPLAGALEQAGLPVAEITLRTQAGLAAIAAIRQAKPHFLLGAGTVRTLEHDAGRPSMQAHRTLSRRGFRRRLSASA